MFNMFHKKRWQWCPHIDEGRRNERDHISNLKLRRALKKYKVV